MANLLDTINKNLKPEATAAPQLGQTEQVSKLLRAKTGKATMDSGPRQSALGERIAAGQARLGGEQIATQQQITQAQQGEQAADIDQQKEIQQQAFESKQKLMGQRFNQQSENLLDAYARGEKTLNTQEDVKNMEQIGFNLRLQNEQYINELQNQGVASRLDDKNSFNEELMRNVFSDQENLLQNDLAFNNIMNIDDNAFRVEMGKMTANHARQMAQDAATAQNKRDKFGAGASMIGTAVQLGAKHSGSMFEDSSGDISGGTE